MNIFTDDYFDPYHLEDVSSEIIEAAEKNLKVKLPAAYIELMYIQNGGELHLKKLMNEELEDGYLEIDYINGIGQKSGEGIVVDSYTRREWGLSNRFVYLHGDSHEWIALDYRRYTGDNPPIVHIDLDTNEKIQIAENFADFISRLTVVEEPNETYHLGDDDEEFAREDIEEALLEGKHKYHMTAGLHYYGLLDEDLHWFLTQMLGSVKRIIDARSFEDTYTIDNYLDILIDMIRTRHVDFNEYSQTEELFELVTNFPPVLDDQSRIRNKSRKIRSYLGK
ncbi:SMI1/KNR4 family protein [Sporosarcina obsidiansis]|uniref:SMI1/KNR4 family protein n=1 Tax=Sporosarcina obsidiansis TaxID=2660748 RepID=UPI0018916C1B|nr:SMI1/KNR4 family protein [Sporosarcina obsidiansis]